MDLSLPNMKTFSTCKGRLTSKLHTHMNTPHWLWKSKLWSSFSQSFPSSPSVSVTETCERRRVLHLLCSASHREWVTLRTQPVYKLCRPADNETSDELDHLGMGGDVIGRQESQCVSVKSQHLFLPCSQRLSIFATLVAQFASGGSWHRIWNKKSNSLNKHKYKLVVHV